VLVRSVWFAYVTSTYRLVTSGVRPGSVLGPVLFLVYINDIVDLFVNSDVYVKLYADGIKMYSEIISDSDQHTLQRSIRKISDWSKTWQLQLANDKCQHNRIRFYTALPSTDYVISDSKLPSVSSVRDLGVIVDNRLTFRDHNNSIVSRWHVRSSRFMAMFVLYKDVCNLITRLLRMYDRCLNIVVLYGLRYLSALSINLSLYSTTTFQFH